MSDYDLIPNSRARCWIFQSQISRGLRLGINSSEQLFSGVDLPPLGRFCLGYLPCIIIGGVKQESRALIISTPRAMEWIILSLH
jgi:hypothetical protein